MKNRRRVPAWLARTIASAIGVVVAFGIFELGLRQLVTSYGPPRPWVAADSIDARVITVRQLDEGIAESHYSIAGARLTGRLPVRDAITIVILGDSYVAAREVADVATMGAQLEDRARLSGIPLNVRQYGWRGASPAQYLLAAQDVIERWHPERVVVVLSNDDFSNSAPIDGPQLRVDAQGYAQVFGPDWTPLPDPVPGSSLRALVRLRGLQLSRRMPRWIRRLEAAPRPAVAAPSFDFTRPPTLPRAAVRSLANAFGSRLAIVYMAEVLVTGGERTDAAEDSLLAGCRFEHVRCASTRHAMLDARRRGIVAHGQPTGDPGLGHLNPAGHALVAEMIWQLVGREIRRTGATEN